MKSLTIKKRPFKVKKNRVKIENKKQVPVGYPVIPEEYRTDAEEKEAFLYTSKINAARNFSKHL